MRYPEFSKGAAACRYEFSKGAAASRYDPVWCCYSPLRPLLSRCSWSMAEFAVDRCSRDRLAASDQWP